MGLVLIASITAVTALSCRAKQVAPKADVVCAHLAHIATEAGGKEAEFWHKSMASQCVSELRSEKARLGISRYITLTTCMLESSSLLVATTECRPD